ncbi:MAG TPA: hypothetical protein VHB27_01675 [Rhodopila sp.]|uniref:hypothetical protein n=1 Tax=Rhodopila sp. TaxID=2480087 RepID=UPI002D11DADB|nr:hypothetical protein [Rhodopila sp.]HVY13908.1 hypothetical protein [Rhodopila sp.]
MKQLRLKHYILAAAMAGLPVAVAQAAPFCIKSQILPPQCIYQDAQQCAKEAQRQGGVCSANPDELTLTPGNGKYCMVTSTHASLCAYGDRATCARDAASQGGVCTDAPPSMGGAGVPDPYSSTDGY